MHGISNWDTHLCPPHNNSVYLITTQNIRAAHWADHKWKAEWLENTMRLRTFIPDTGTHPPGMTLPRRAWGPAQPPLLRCQTFSLLLVQIGYGILCGLWVWHRRTSGQPCCPPMSNPSTSPCTARPDGSGRWGNPMVAQHLPRDPVRPSSGQ